MTPDWNPDDADGLPYWLASDAGSGEAALPDLDALFPPDADAGPQPEPAAAAEQVAGRPFEYGTQITLPTRLTALGVRVEHEVPAGLRVVGTIPKATRAGGSLAWQFDRVKPGQVLTLRVLAEPTDSPGWTPREPAKFSTTYTSRGASTAPIARPAVAVRLSGPERFEAGSVAEFTARVENTGNWPLVGVTARVELPPGLEAVSDVEQQIGDLAVGGSAAVAVRVYGAAAGAGSLQVVVSAPEGVTAAAETTTEVTAPALTVALRGPDRWRVNHAAEVTLTVTNPGTSVARPVAVTLTVPVGWDVPADVPFDRAIRTAFWTVDEIPAGGSFAMTLVIRPTLPGAGRFAAAAESPGIAAAAELAATATIDPADSDDLLGRFVREVGFDPILAEAPDSKLVAARERAYPHIVFAVGGTEYALPLDAVREVGRPPAITPLPGSPAWLLGVANVRGDIVSMVDLRAFLGAPPAPPGADRRLLVVTAPGGKLTAGLLVDRVRGLRSVPPAEVRPPTAPLPGPAAAYLSGVAAADGRPLAVLAPDRLLLAPEFRPFPAA